MDDSKTLVDLVSVIAALGGAEKVAALTKAKSANVVNNWPRLGFFPSKTFLVMTEELRRCGYSAPAWMWRQIEPEGQAA